MDYYVSHIFQACLSVCLCELKRPKTKKEAENGLELGGRQEGQSQVQGNI